MDASDSDGDHPVGMMARALQRFLTLRFESDGDGILVKVGLREQIDPSWD